MKETIQDTAHQLFFEICEKKPIDIDMFFLEQQYFPKIDYEPRMTIYFSTPREIQGLQTIQGCIFSNLENSQSTIFSLFLASVIHAAGHAKVTDYKKYKKWMKGKNKKRAIETFEFIEDIRVNEFLKKDFPEYYSEIEKITSYFTALNEKKVIGTKGNSKRIFSDRFLSNIKKQRRELKKEILNLDSENSDEFIKIADIIYESSNILSDHRLPFVDHYSHPKKIEKWVENVKLDCDGKFQETVERFGEIWFEQNRFCTRKHWRIPKTKKCNSLVFEKDVISNENDSKRNG
jgi:ferritin-like protein